MAGWPRGCATGPSAPTATLCRSRRGGLRQETGVDAVLAAARAVDISSDQVEIGLPTGPGTTWTVTEIHRAFPTAVDAAAVDPTTLQVTDTVRFADYPFMAKLARWGVDLHMGVLFGLPNQIVLAGLAVAWPPWWCSATACGGSGDPPARPGCAPGRPFPPGGLAALPWPGLLAVAAVTITTGLFLPLLGISLAAFLLVDLTLSMRRRRARTTA